MTVDDRAAWLHARRSEVDAALARLCTAGAAPGSLGAASAYALDGGGKRMRPILVLGAFEAAWPSSRDPGPQRRAAWPAAVAVELVHAYSLVHDDLPAMDDDDFRRGRPSTHRAYTEATAILAGDALLTEAFRILADPASYPPGTPASLRVDLVLHLAEAAGHRGMVGGQALDLGLSGPITDGVALDALHRAKTGALFAFASAAGGMAAGAPREQVAALQTYGEELGLAFQIADDLLDLVQDGTESLDGPPSYASLLGEEASRARCAELVDSAIAALAILPGSLGPLVDLAHFAVARDH